jgi:hypothetical protein
MRRVGDTSAYNAPMFGSPFKKSALAAAVALMGATLADATPASADVSVGVEVAPEITVAEPEEVTVTTEPPDPVYEERLDMPGPGYVWVGGSWAWTGAEWGWYPGRWLMAPEGRLYIEPYYERVGPNVVFVRGYWGRPDAPRRYYGGERIRFAEAVRPVDYRRGEPPHFERRAGVAIGTRPAGFYEHGTGPVRPLPRAAGPSYRPAPRETQVAHPQPGRDPAGRDRAIAPERSMARPVPIAHNAPPPRAAPAARPAPRRK